MTNRLPAEERFGLIAQLRRAAASIPTNIVEGCSRSSGREYGRFLEVAAGSAAEVRYLLRLARDLQMLTEAEMRECCECSDHVVRSLQKLQDAVERFDG